MATRELNNSISRKKKLPENMHRIAEINEKAREHGMSYGKYVSKYGDTEHSISE